jgi:hypothetical protein
MGLSGCLGLDVRMSVTPLLQRVQNYMSKRNKGSQLERELEAEAKQGLKASVYFEETFRYFTLY